MVAHLFVEAVGKVSGLSAGGQMLLAWILQYTRSQPRMIKVCWEFDVDTFAAFE